MKKISIFFMLISLFGILIGCQNANNENSATSETIVVEDAKGSVEIPAEPQRIVDLSGNSDILHILGFNVIGTANSDAYDYTKLPEYLNDALSDAKILGYSMQDTMDVEGILELNPDLIILSSVQEKMYEQLKTIAPTVMIQLEQIDWKEDVRNIAKIFNKTSEADAWISKYEADAKAKGAEVKETFGADTTYLPILASGGQLFVFDAAGIGSVLFDDMGLVKPDHLPQQENISLPVISYEGLAEIDADYFVLVGTQEDIQALKQSPIYQSMRAVKEGHVIELPSSPYFNKGYSVIGRNDFISEFKGLMSK